jgi:hypothetical protein
VGSNPIVVFERDTMNDRVQVYEPPIGMSIYRVIEEAVRRAPARFEVNNTTFETCKGEPFEEALERYQKEFKVEVVSDEEWRRRRLELAVQRRVEKAEEFCLKCDKTVEVKVERTSDRIRWFCPHCQTTLDTMDQEDIPRLPVVATEKICIGCGDTLTCGAGTGSCWCNDLPKVMTVPNDKAGCYCPKCLKQQIELQGEGTDKTSMSE